MRAAIDTSRWEVKLPLRCFDWQDDVPSAESFAVDMYGPGELYIESTGFERPPKTKGAVKCIVQVEDGGVSCFGWPGNIESAEEYAERKYGKGAVLYVESSSVRPASRIHDVEREYAAEK